MIKCISIFIFSVVIFNTCVIAQERILFYDVIRNGKVIGKIDFIEFKQGSKRSFTMTSNVKTSYIFSFTDNTVETGHYENGILVYSTFHQKQTGSGETNKSATAVGNFYKLIDNGKTKMVNFGQLRCGMLKLYVDVPDTISKVFSGNYQKLCDLKKVEENKYKLTIEEGKYNYYTYKNGVCVKVEIERPMVSLQFVLRAIQ
ncbi:MAG: hypothetical protein M3004_00655 [Bacteroidota bacterium]|nr:hypothetical protein [Bacteroidota bacterium]